MSIRHLPWLDPDKWYIISISRGDDGENPSWRQWGVWLHWPNGNVHAEWSLFGKYRFGYGVKFGRNGSESDLGLDLHAGWFGNIYLRIKSPWTAWMRVRPDMPDRYETRHTGISVFPYSDCYLKIQFEDRECWVKGQPWYRSWSFGRSSLFGRATVARTEIGSGTTFVPMPEGNYHATWKAEVLVWRHQRPIGTWIDHLFRVRTRTDVWIDVPGGIPHAGKGENSWDCGMDGLMGAGGKTVEEAVANAIQSVLRDRKRYGGPNDLTGPMTVSEAAAR